MKYLAALILIIPALGLNCSGHQAWNAGEDSSLPASGKQDSPEEVKPALKWQGTADSCTFVLTENFLNKEEGFFWSTPGDIGKSSGDIYWQQAHAMDVIIAAYGRVKDSDSARAAEYRRYMEAWYSSYAHNYNTSHRKDGVHGGFFNQYTDDMCWICLTLCHISEAIGSRQYIQTAKAVYDNYIIPRAVTDYKGTGLPWTDIQGKQGRNSCTNAPGCCLAAKLYVESGDQKYLDDALMLYRFMTDNNIKQDYRCEEPPLTYTQGTFGEACRQLYGITGEKKYLDMAFNVIRYAFTSSRCNTADGILRSEGTSMDQSIFKAVLIPYAVNLILDESLDRSSRTMLKNLLLKNGNALYRSLDRSTWPQMFAGYCWDKAWTATDSAPHASMGAQTSGASLMEGLAKLERTEYETK